MNQAKLKKIVFRCLHYLLMGTISVMMLLPFSWMIATSMRKASDSFTLPPAIFPTIWNGENYRRVFENLKICKYMANSLIVGCLMMGMDFTIACPNGYRPSADVLFFAREYGDHFKLTTAPDEAARGADVLFTDVWTSMGMERETERRRRDFNGFCLDAARMALAKPDCIVQHPLPAHRGEEITPDVFETHADEIFDEAENRLHVEKAVLGILLAGK